MNAFREWIVVAALAALAVAAYEARAETPYQQHENVVYGEADGVGLVMDVFTPTGAANGLAIVDVASGAWHSDRGKINDHKRAQMFDIFCQRGYTVFAVRPGSQTKFCVPEMLDHVKQGIRWVKAHKDQYGIDPDRVGLTGASAGGHLASLAAVTADDGDRVKAVAVFFPPTDFTNYGGQKIEVGGESRLGTMLSRLLFPGGVSNRSPEEIDAQVKQISPALQVSEGSPPFLLIHGDADPLVPLQQSETLLAALHAKGVEAELIVKPGGGHPWLTIHEEVAKFADWFDEQLPKD